MPSLLHLGKYYPPDTGGIESVTAAVARAAAAAGWQTEVLCFGEHAHGDAVDQGVVVRRVPQALKPASQPLGLRYAYEALKRGRQADVVHIHAPNMLAALLTPLLGPRPKVVVHWHSDIVGKGLLARLLRPIERAMLRRCDRVVCTSRPYADYSATLADFASKVSVVPLGAPAPANEAAPAADRSSLPERLRLHVADRPIVLAVGRLVPYKGFDVLIDAAKRMRTNAAIVIVGGGPLQAHLQSLIERHGVADRVMLAGRVDDATLLALQRLACMFCMPSVERSEAFGVALIEAMSHGLPLLATQIPGSGVPWVNAQDVSGINVPPGDPEALAQALDRLLADSALREHLGRGAASRFAELFTVERSCEQMLGVYQSLLTPESFSRP